MLEVEPAEKLSELKDDFFYANHIHDEKNTSFSPANVHFHCQPPLPPSLWVLLITLFSCASVVKVMRMICTRCYRLRPNLSCLSLIDEGDVLDDEMVIMLVGMTNATPEILPPPQYVIVTVPCPERGDGRDDDGNDHRGMSLMR